MTDTLQSTSARQIAQAALAFEKQRTGHAPDSVTVVLSENTLVITLHGALSPAERALATNPAGAAQVQDFHRRLFVDASHDLRQEIKRITGVEVREAIAEVEPATGTVVAVFTSGTTVQVFQLAGSVPDDSWSSALDRAAWIADCLFHEKPMKLNRAHRTTYDAIYQHPLAHNLDWRDVFSMLGALGELSRDPKGNVKVVRNGHSMVLYPSRNKNVAEAEELMAIRRFLQRSEPLPAAPAAAGTQLLVVIDHRQARVYTTELHGSVPQSIAPYDPHGFGRHLHYVQDDSNGQRKPEQKRFYEAVAKTLEGAERILIFGSSTGGSSAMENLLARLKRDHPGVAARVVGSIAVDETHLSDDQLLAKARQEYAKLASQDELLASAAQPQTKSKSS